jgi:hypothetical protein
MVGLLEMHIPQAVQTKGADTVSSNSRVIVSNSARSLNVSLRSLPFMMVCSRPK